MKKSDDGHAVRVPTTPSIVRISFANCGKRKSKRRAPETVTGEQERGRDSTASEPVSPGGTVSERANAREIFKQKLSAKSLANG